MSYRKKFNGTMDARNILNRKQASLNNFNGKSSNSKLAIEDARNLISSVNKYENPRNRKGSFDARSKIQSLAVSVNTNKRGTKYQKSAPKSTIRKTFAIENNRNQRGMSERPMASSKEKSLESINVGYKSNHNAFVNVSSNGERKMRSKVEMENYAMKINIRNDSRNEFIRKRSTSPDADNFSTKIKLNRKSNRTVPYEHKHALIHNTKNSYSASPPPVADRRANQNMASRDVDMRQRNTSSSRKDRDLRRPIEDFASPFEGTKIVISNLCLSVTEEDIQELFSAMGPVKRAKMLEAGTAEVVYVRQDDALEAIRKYNNRKLDGQQMKLNLKRPGRSKEDGKWYSWMEEIGVKQKSSGKDVIELDSKLLLKALFKSSSREEDRAPVLFTVKV